MLKQGDAVPVRFIKYSKFVIYGLLLFVVILLLANNWNAVYYAGISSWCILLPVAAFLLVENAVKIWGIKRFAVKVAFYVMDVVSILVLTIFSDGALISTLYIVILSDFYVNQRSLINNVVMGASCIATFLVTFAVSNAMKGISVNVVTLVSTMLNDILLIAFHFFILNFAVQIYNKNKEITKTLEELNVSNEKLQVAYRELQEITVLEERQRIAKDIHDTAGHSITTVIMQTEAAKLVIDSDPADAKRKITAANLQAKHALEELRGSVHLLSGSHNARTLKDQILEIIHDSSDGTDVVFRFDIEDAELCDAKQRFLLNTLKEGISNGLRHGGATAFYVEFKRDKDAMNFLLSDNGKGAKLSSLKEGFGLAGMHARAESLGGQVWFETEEGEGFEIHLRLPSDEGKR